MKILNKKHIWTTKFTLLITFIFFYLFYINDFKPNYFFTAASTKYSPRQNSNLLLPKSEHQKTDFFDETGLDEKIQNIIMTENSQLYSFETLTKDHEKRLNEVALTLTQTDLMQLKNIVLNSENPSDARFIALNFLILRKLDSHHLLNTIFFHPHELLEQTFDAHDVRSVQKDIELNLRFLALEQIEKNLIDNRSIEYDISNLKTRNQYLIKLAKIVHVSNLVQKPQLAEMTQQLLPSLSSSYE